MLPVKIGVSEARVDLSLERMGGYVVIREKERTSSYMAFFLDRVG